MSLDSRTVAAHISSPRTQAAEVGGFCEFWDSRAILERSCVKKKEKGKTCFVLLFRKDRLTDRLKQESRVRK